MSIEMTSAAQAQSEAEVVGNSLSSRERTDEERRAYALQIALDRAREVGNSAGALDLRSVLVDADCIATWLRDGSTVEA